MQDDYRGAGASIALRKVRFWTVSTRLIILAAVGAPLGYVLGRMGSGIPPSPREVLLLAVVTLVIVALVTFVRWRTRPHSAPALERIDR